MSGGRTADGLRLAAFLTVATAAQLAFWWLATPGPVLLEGAERGPDLAMRTIALSLATLLAAALLAAPLLRMPLRRQGWAWGGSGRWLPLAGLLALIAAPVLWLQASSPALAATYPWISVDWLSSEPGRWALWAPAYALYYLAFEGFYRGAVLHGLRPRLGDVGANAAQAMLATLIHVGKPLAETLAAFPASLLFGWLTLRSRSLLPALLLHLAIGLILDAALVARGTP
ncbi:MAG: CPBP family intramembrane metalloprotease [Deinococcus-Thermus bacterium]|nr:CPBP family intramembrane metalloprotease [Deinococcota bacterium]